MEHISLVVVLELIVVLTAASVAWAVLEGTAAEWSDYAAMEMMNLRLAAAAAEHPELLEDAGLSASAGHS